VWSDASGDAPGASVPTSADNVFLDANSGAVTLTVNATASFKDLDCTGFTGTLAGTSEMRSYGLVFKLASGMMWSGRKSAVRFYGPGSGTVLITCSGIRINCDTLYFQATGAAIQLQDTFLINVGMFLFSAGSFDANSKIVDADIVTASLRIIGNFTASDSFYDLTISNSSPAGDAREITIESGTISCTRNLSILANSADARNRPFLRARPIGTERTITVAGAVDFEYVDFMDIKGAGDADWDLSAAVGGSGDVGGNSGITFTAPGTSYLVGSTSSLYFHNTTAWASSSGGTGGTGRVPLPQDTIRLDANSGTGIRYQNLLIIGTLDCTGFAGTINFSWTCYIAGSVTFASTMVVDGVAISISIVGRGNHTITCAGKTIIKSLIFFYSFGGKYTLMDDFSSSAFVGCYGGTLDAAANNVNVTVSQLSISGSDVRTIKMGSGIWTITGHSGYLFYSEITTNLTFEPGTSVIKFTGALTGAIDIYTGGLAFYDWHNATTGNFAIIMRQTCSFNQFKVNPGRKQQFYRGHTFTAAEWVLEGESGNLIEIRSDGGVASAHTLAKSGGGTVTAKFCDIAYSTASPAETFQAKNSTDSGNNSGWLFKLAMMLGADIAGTSAADTPGALLARGLAGAIYGVGIAGSIGLPVFDRGLAAAISGDTAAADIHALFYSALIASIMGRSQTSDLDIPLAYLFINPSIRSMTVPFALGRIAQQYRIESSTINYAVRQPPHLL
jgi:hypothetical protein